MLSWPTGRREQLKLKSGSVELRLLEPAAARNARRTSGT